jgi:hypothetical protein
MLNPSEQPAVLQELDTDYLVIGAGAMGMAFVDELVTRSRDVRVILVDRRATPGGHWNDAYRFVTLHQPASFYGVNSEPLGPGGDAFASGAEIMAYYERVLEKLCATGRVRFFPQCEYEGDGRFRSTVAHDDVYQTTVHRKTVDATYSQVEVPAMRPPQFGVAAGVSLVPINGLAELDRPWSRYVVIGAGKTGIDALLFLLGRGVDPDRLTWIISHDVWLMNRKLMFAKVIPGSVLWQLRSHIRMTSFEDFFPQWEEGGWAFRLDEKIEPTRFRCTSVIEEELSALRRISHVVRMGRVVSIEPDAIVLEEGSVPTHADVLHVDCTAHGLPKRPARPVFEGARITLQPLIFCQPAFSAAMTARLETWSEDDAAKNARSTPVPHPEFPTDVIAMGIDTMENSLKWLLPFGWWLMRSRLSVTAHLSFLGLLRILVAALCLWRPAMKNLVRIRAELDDPPASS